MFATWDSSRSSCLPLSVSLSPAPLRLPNSYFPFHSQEDLSVWNYSFAFLTSPGWVLEEKLSTCPCRSKLLFLLYLQVEWLVFFGDGESLCHTYFFLTLNAILKLILGGNEAPLFDLQYGLRIWGFVFCFCFFAHVPTHTANSPFPG